MQDFDSKDDFNAETQEWLQALDDILHHQGEQPARKIIEHLIDSLQAQGYAVPVRLNAPYINTIPANLEAKMPGHAELEYKIQALVRWNAVAMVIRAGQVDPDLGGHIGTFASSALLYEVGFNHFWRAPKGANLGDLIFYQGHASPGIYARSYLAGELTEDQLIHFRREILQPGLSSYPHPWLMPDYWQFPTVSMGLGPLQAIYTARFMRYLRARNLSDTNTRKVWCFCGDGEMDEPESLGALTVASREQLDNLVFVVNCNLQRLDGPVRGNAKIIQELEALFLGAGWNVIKLIWGHAWDALLAKDNAGWLKKRMMEACDGEYQNFKARGGAYTRQHFFGKYPELLAMVEHLSDSEIANLNRGGHDVQKIYAAYHQASQENGKPTVILAKTVKGYGLGSAGEALNTAHNTKKMAVDQLKAFRDRFDIPVSDAEIETVPFYRPKASSPEMKYLQSCREALGGHLPQRRRQASSQLSLPTQDFFKTYLAEFPRPMSSTMGFVRLLGALCKQPDLGKRIVPIIPDEARTFGMEGMFRQVGIYSVSGPLYTPVDADQVMFYKEAKDGQILEEGINEAGAFCSWLAAATSYSTNDCPMVPFYTYYSMFGFQRIGDLIYAAGDSRARGFLIGATAGRTTLNGEGLQHEDGHSHILANTVPNCISYDPCFIYELAIIIQGGLRRMFAEHEDVFYYLTTMNENYAQPAMPKGAEEGILKGIYCLKPSKQALDAKCVQLFGSGTILNEVIAAAKLLKDDYKIDSQIWSVTSYNELTRDGQACARWNRLHPEQEARQAYLSEQLQGISGPVIAASDYMRNHAEQVRAYVPQDYYVLGTDGYGRSDTRASLRQFFEVDRFHIVVQALSALSDKGLVSSKVVSQALKRYQIDSNKPNPMSC